MSTLNVDSTLFQETKAVTSAQGKTVDEFVADALRQAVRSAGPQPSTRNGLPTMVVNGTTPAIGPRKVRQSIEEDGF